MIISSSFTHHLKYHDFLFHLILNETDLTFLAIWDTLEHRLRHNDHVPIIIAYLGIEVSSALGIAVRIFKGHALLIYTFAHQRVIDIRDRHDTRLNGNLLPLQTVRIPGAIHPFVMIMRYIFRQHFKAFILRIAQNRTEHLRAFRRVKLHLFKFLRRKTSRLPEDLIIDRDLSDVMQRGSLDQVILEFRRNPVLPCKFRILHDLLHEEADHVAGPYDMPAGRVVTALNQLGHAADQVIVHLQDVCGLLIHLPLQVLVVMVDQLDVLLVFGVIRDNQLKPPLLPVVEEVIDIDQIDPVQAVVVVFILLLISLEQKEPRGEELIQRPALLQRPVYRQVI